MKPFPDRLNDRLENQNIAQSGKTQAELPQVLTPGIDTDSDVEELAMLARRLQTSPHLQVDSAFAQRLETHILAHQATLSRRQASTARKNGIFLRSRRAPFALGIALICLLLLITGTLTVAARVTNPKNPLYEITQWMQRVQHPQAQVNPAVVRAETNWRTAHHQLGTLDGLADAAHATAYQQSLKDLDQQINALTRSIEALPAGPDRDNLSNKLEMLKGQARQTLRSLLPRQTLSEKLLTTNELGELGDTIPHIDGATMNVFLHGEKRATINVVGEGIQPGAELLIDNQLIVSNGSLQNNKDVFAVSWSSEQSPGTIGLLNPDGTMAQTTTISFTIADANGNGNSNSNSNENGKWNNNGNSSGNGNGNGDGNNSGNGSGNSNSSDVSSSGNGNGNGDGNGNGNSSGNGNGSSNSSNVSSSGNGSGNGNGDGNGNGNSSGNGNGSSNSSNVSSSGNGSSNGNSSGNGNGKGNSSENGNGNENSNGSGKGKGNSIATPTPTSTP